MHPFPTKALGIADPNFTKTIITSLIISFSLCIKNEKKFAMTYWFQERFDHTKIPRGLTYCLGKGLTIRPKAITKK